MDECVRSMLTNIEVDNAAKLLYYSDLYGLTELKAKVLHFIGLRATKVMKSPGWKQYVAIKPQLMEHLIEKMAGLKM